MPDGLIARLWAGLLATSPLEALAVLSSLVYVALAVPRSRWCWVAGGVGTWGFVLSALIAGTGGSGAVSLGVPAAGVAGAGPACPGA